MLQPKLFPAIEVNRTDCFAAEGLKIRRGVLPCKRRGVGGGLGGCKRRQTETPILSRLRVTQQTSLPKAWSSAEIAYAFDNVSFCAKGVNSLLHKELAASIEVIS